MKTLSRLAAAALLALCLSAVVACNTVPPDPARPDAPKVYRVDLNKARGAAGALVTVLKGYAVTLRAKPSFDAAKQADLDKALAALDVAHAALKALPDGDHTAGEIVGNVAAAAMPVIAILPLDDAQAAIAFAAVAAVQIVAPLLGEATPLDEPGPKWALLSR